MTEPRKPLLIVEDDPALQKQMRWAFDAYETVVAEDRESAIARMERALAETRIDGVKTTIGFHRRLLRNPRFAKGRVTTGMLDEG